MVGRNRVSRLRRAAVLAGLPRKRWKPKQPAVYTASDLVNRDFDRPEPNQLWVTDITEHRTIEGKLYCAVVLDTFSRRVVGWSIDASQTSTLVTNALSMASQNRSPERSSGLIIHSDHGTQSQFNRSTHHWLVPRIVSAPRRPLLVFSSRGLFESSWALHRDKSVPLGK